LARGLNTITRGIPDPSGATQRAIRALDEAINQRDLRLDELEDTIDGLVVTGAAVASVTAGSNMVTCSPTTGAVVVNVVPANFTGIPQAGVVFSGTANRVSKFSGASLVDSNISDNGSLVTVTSPLFVDNNVTLGDDAATDAHVINGKLDLTSTQNTSALTATLNGSGMTAVNASALRGLNTSTVSTAAGNNNAVGVWAEATATESGGGNTLTNIGLLALASGGDAAEAIRAEAGNVILNRTSGQTAWGTTTPDANAKAHVRVGASGAVAAIAGSSLVTETSGVSYITIKGPAATAKGVLFSNPSSANDGGVIYDSSARGLIFTTGGGTTRLTIDSSGNATFAQTLTVTGNAAFNGNTRIGNANTDLVGFYTTAGSAQQTINALTDSTGGTANDTLQALPDPTDTPASADALRDDLVANLIPALRNNFADLAAKVNDLRTVLRNLGLLA
jgi:hypothetical protein